jgi:hypothetical protein
MKINEVEEFSIFNIDDIEVGSRKALKLAPSDELSIDVLDSEQFLITCKDSHLLIKIVQDKLISKCIFKSRTNVDAFGSGPFTETIKGFLGAEHFLQSKEFYEVQFFNVRDGLDDIVIDNLELDQEYIKAKELVKENEDRVKGIAHDLFVSDLRQSKEVADLIDRINDYPDSVKEKIRSSTKKI